MANLRMMQQQADLYNEQLGKYGQAAQQYNLASDVYNRQVKEYQAIVDAYNANPAVVKYKQQAEAYNAALPSYNEQVSAYQSAINAYNQKVNVWNNQVVKFTNGRGYNYFTPAQLQAELDSRRIHPNSPNGQAYASQLNAYRVGSPPSVPTAPTKPTEPNVERPGDFTAKKPEMSMEMPKDPGFTGQQMEQLMGKQSAAKQEMAGQQETGLVERAMTGKKQKPDSLIGGILQNVRYST